jgi:hypothetical protein
MKIRTLSEPQATSGDSKLAADITNKRGFAECWGVSTRTVDNWLRAGLPHMKLSARMIRISVGEGGEWLRSRFGTQRLGANTRSATT